MYQNRSPHDTLLSAEFARRLIIWFFIIAVPWVPGAVALAMILTGHVGD
jgi:hypothetical protein